MIIEIVVGSIFGIGFIIGLVKAFMYYCKQASEDDKSDSIESFEGMKIVWKK